MPRQITKKVSPKDPQHFTENNGLWSCNVCTGRNPSRLLRMNPKAALRHEASSEHKQSIALLDAWDLRQDEDAWFTPMDYSGLYDAKALEQMQHIDSLRDFIPFWRQQIEAAYRGEVLRFADFLDALAKEEGEKPTWDAPLPDWAVKPIETSTSHSERGNGALNPNAHVGAQNNADELGRAARSTCEGGDEEAYLFVEEIARMRSTSRERRKEMHSFYRVSIAQTIPTDEKLTKIRELIDFLRHP